MAAMRRTLVSSPAYLTSIRVPVDDRVDLYELESALYGTPWKSWWLFTNPYIGASHHVGTDLVWNPSIHGLDDPNRRWNMAYLGFKLHLVTVPDPKGLQRFGFLRLELALAFDKDFHRYDGTYLEATYWF